MKRRFNWRGVHQCEAVVLACIDFRFWKDTVQFIEEELGIKSYDFPKLPGAAKAINECKSNSDITMSCIDVPCRLHHVNRIVIVNHADCGAYGGSEKFGFDPHAEQKFHEAELQKAKEKILARYPEKEIVLLYAKLVDNEKNVEFLVIK